jgi:hypothetical protein
MMFAITGLATDENPSFIVTLSNGPMCPIVPQKGSNMGRSWKQFVKGRIIVRMTYVFLSVVAFAAGVTFSPTTITAAMNPSYERFQSARRAYPEPDAKQLNKRRTMTNQTRTAVAKGSWAGNGIKLEIGDASSSLQFACAEGAIAEKLFQDANGDFSATGTFTRRTPGPQREGGVAAQNASFVGRIAGRSMTMKIVLTESKTSVGEFTLELDKRVRLQKCL